MWIVIKYGNWSFSVICLSVHILIISWYLHQLAYKTCNYNIQPKNKMSKSWLKKFNLQYWTSPYFTNIPSLQVRTSTASDQLRICASWTLFICFSRYADSYFSVARLWWLQNFANHKVWFSTLVNLHYKFKK